MQLVILDEDGINSLLCNNEPVDDLLLHSEQFLIPFLRRLKFRQHLLLSLF